MGVETFLHFWSQHNTAIIESLIGVILLTGVYLAVRAFLTRGDELAGTAPAAGSADLGELEKTLKKLLENQAPAMAGGAGAVAGASPEEIQKLKLEIAEKETQLAEAKKAAAGATGAMSEADKKALEDKVKDLEGRLAEYEIISEDIADLSFYKEENGKLQKEIEALKGGGVTAAAPAAPAPVAAAPAPAAPAPVPAAPAADGALVATPEAAPAAAAPTAAPAAPPDNSDLMNQFENFVKKS